jgi:hypothetical protein
MVFLILPIVALTSACNLILSSILINNVCVAWGNNYQITGHTNSLYITSWFRHFLLITIIFGINYFISHWIVELFKDGLMRSLGIAIFYIALTCFLSNLLCYINLRSLR